MSFFIVRCGFKDEKHDAEPYELLHMFHKMKPLLRQGLEMIKGNQGVVFFCISEQKLTI